jgi:hypothetical protein
MIRRRLLAGQHIERNRKYAQRQQNMNAPQRMGAGGNLVVDRPVAQRVVNTADQQQQNARVDKHFEKAPQFQERGAAGLRFQVF